MVNPDKIYTDSGNTIKIFLKKCDNGYRFSVYNEGKNIPNEYKDMLFNILYKTDKDEAYASSFCV